MSVTSSGSSSGDEVTRAKPRGKFQKRPPSNENLHFVVDVAADPGGASDASSSSNDTATVRRVQFGTGQGDRGSAAPGGLETHISNSSAAAKPANNNLDARPGLATVSFSVSYGGEDSENSSSSSQGDETVRRARGLRAGAGGGDDETTRRAGVGGRRRRPAPSTASEPPSFTTSQTRGSGDASSSSGDDQTVASGNKKKGASLGGKHLSPSTSGPPREQHDPHDRRDVTQRHGLTTRAAHSAVLNLAGAHQSTAAAAQVELLRELEADQVAERSSRRNDRLAEHTGEGAYVALSGKMDGRIDVVVIATSEVCEGGVLFPSTTVVFIFFFFFFFFFFFGAGALHVLRQALLHMNGVNCGCTGQYCASGYQIPEPCSHFPVPYLHGTIHE